MSPAPEAKAQQATRILVTAACQHASNLRDTCHAASRLLDLLEFDGMSESSRVLFTWMVINCAFANGRAALLEEVRQGNCGVAYEDMHGSMLFKSSRYILTRL
jgi:hypothetical protein